uniref:Uncharacterized protein n=1 Tax=Chromera velia CCMP2878 TaxID=1169474 RepID=A0A0G4HC96_9ALVE|eukprot:Cvel_26146.t1-p1 / transcript=Cvel_26146.t1 / gene=Cvel_26146 / organism=Chromera_velia_CCMP2878 / gene_product=hypothetical protein / transcript_product=hypothetical protein / location=Cvel_scaffold3065:3305-14820(-) / protein_length=2148 / sequence_SO=supercontig / SO=protein_coding / is_pseudo=false
MNSESCASQSSASRFGKKWCLLDFSADEETRRPSHPFFLSRQGREKERGRPPAIHSLPHSGVPDLESCLLSRSVSISSEGGGSDADRSAPPSPPSQRRTRATEGGRMEGERNGTMASTARAADDSGMYAPVSRSNEGSEWYSSRRGAEEMEGAQKDASASAETLTRPSIPIRTDKFPLDPPPTRHSRSLLEQMIGDPPPTNSVDSGHFSFRPTPRGDRERESLDDNALMRPQGTLSPSHLSGTNGQHGERLLNAAATAVAASANDAFLFAGPQAPPPPLFGGVRRSPLLTSTHDAPRVRPSHSLSPKMERGLSGSGRGPGMTPLGRNGTFPGDPPTPPFGVGREVERDGEGRGESPMTSRRMSIHPDRQRGGGRRTGRGGGGGLTPRSAPPARRPGVPSSPFSPLASPAGPFRRHDPAEVDISSETSSQQDQGGVRGSGNGLLFGGHREESGDEEESEFEEEFGEPGDTEKDEFASEWVTSFVDSLGAKGEVLRMNRGGYSGSSRPGAMGPALSLSPLSLTALASMHLPVPLRLVFWGDDTPVKKILFAAAAGLYLPPGCDSEERGAGGEDSDGVFNVPLVVRIFRGDRVMGGGGEVFGRDREREQLSVRVNGQLLEASEVPRWFDAVTETRFGQEGFGHDLRVPPVTIDIDEGPSPLSWEERRKGGPSLHVIWLPSGLNFESSRSSRSSLLRQLRLGGDRDVPIGFVHVGGLFSSPAAFGQPPQWFSETGRSRRDGKGVGTQPPWVGREDGEGSGDSGSFVVVSGVEAWAVERERRQRGWGSHGKGGGLLLRQLLTPFFPSSASKLAEGRERRQSTFPKLVLLEEGGGGHEAETTAAVSRGLDGLGKKPTQTSIRPVAPQLAEVFALAIQRAFGNSSGGPQGGQAGVSRCSFPLSCLEEVEKAAGAVARQCWAKRVRILLRSACRRAGQAEVKRESAEIRSLSLGGTSLAAAALDFIRRTEERARLLLEDRGGSLPLALCMNSPFVHRWARTLEEDLEEAVRMAEDLWPHRVAGGGSRQAMRSALKDDRETKEDAEKRENEKDKESAPHTTEVRLVSGLSVERVLFFFLRHLKRLDPQLELSEDAAAVLLASASGGAVGRARAVAEWVRSSSLESVRELLLLSAACCGAVLRRVLLASADSIREEALSGSRSGPASLVAGSDGFWEGLQSGISEFSSSRAQRMAADLEGEAEEHAAALHLPWASPPPAPREDQEAARLQAGAVPPLPLANRRGAGGDERGWAMAGERNQAHGCLRNFQEGDADEKERRKETRETAELRSEAEGRFAKLRECLGVLLEVKGTVFMCLEGRRTRAMAGEGRLDSFGDTLRGSLVYSRADEAARLQTDPGGTTGASLWTGVRRRSRDPPSLPLSSHATHTGGSRLVRVDRGREGGGGRTGGGGGAPDSCTPALTSPVPSPSNARVPPPTAFTNLKGMEDRTQGWSVAVGSTSLQHQRDGAAFNRGVAAAAAAVGGDQKQTVPDDEELKTRFRICSPEDQLRLEVANAVEESAMLSVCIGTLGEIDTEIVGNKTQQSDEETLHSRWRGTPLGFRFFPLPPCSNTRTGRIAIPPPSPSGSPRTVLSSPMPIVTPVHTPVVRPGSPNFGAKAVSTELSNKSDFIPPSTPPLRGDARRSNCAPDVSTQRADGCTLQEDARGGFALPSDAHAPPLHANPTPSVPAPQQNVPRGLSQKGSARGILESRKAERDTRSVRANESQPREEREAAPILDQSLQTGPTGRAEGETKTTKTAIAAGAGETEIEFQNHQKYSHEDQPQNQEGGVFSSLDLLWSSAHSDARLPFSTHRDREEKGEANSQLEWAPSPSTHPDPTKESHSSSDLPLTSQRAESPNVLDNSKAALNPPSEEVNGGTGEGTQRMKEREVLDEPVGGDRDGGHHGVSSRVRMERNPSTARAAEAEGLVRPTKREMLDLPSHSQPGPAKGRGEGHLGEVECADGGTSSTEELVGGAEGQSSKAEGGKGREVSEEDSARRGTAAELGNPPSMSTSCKDFHAAFPHSTSSSTNTKTPKTQKTTGTGRKSQGRPLSGHTKNGVTLRSFQQNAGVEREAGGNRGCTPDTTSRATKQSDPLAETERTPTAAVGLRSSVRSSRDSALSGRTDPSSPPARTGTLSAELAARFDRRRQLGLAEEVFRN